MAVARAEVQVAALAAVQAWQIFDGLTIENPELQVKETVNDVQVADPAEQATTVVVPKYPAKAVREPEEVQVATPVPQAWQVPAET